MAVQYQYAEDTNGRLVHIKDANELDGPFFCPFCHEKMVKKCGKKNDWHFAHDHNRVNCSYETYLHIIAKKSIKNWIEKSSVINVYYSQKTYCSKLKESDSCNFKRDAKYSCYSYTKTCHNIKSILNKCELEKQKTIGGINYTPDVLWYSSSDPNNFIFVEIFVTHECTEEKQNSGARIIEFRIENEEDIQAIVSTNYIKPGPKVVYYGFNPKDIYVEVLPEAHVQLEKFTVYESGKTYMTSCNCLNYLQHKSKSVFELVVLRSYDSTNDVRNWGIAEALRRNIPVGSCTMCRFYSYHDYSGTSKCNKIKALVTNTSAAVACKKMWLREEYRTKYHDEFAAYKNGHFTSVWENENKPVNNKNDLIDQLNAKALQHELFVGPDYPITDEERLQWTTMSYNISKRSKDNSDYIDSLLKVDVAPSYLNDEYDGDSLTPGVIIRRWSVSARFPLCPPREIENPLSEYVSRLKKGRILAVTSIGELPILGSQLTIYEGKDAIAVACMDMDNIHYHIFIVTYEEGYYIHEHFKKYYEPAGLVKHYSALVGDKWTSIFLLDDGIV